MRPTHRARRPELPALLVSALLLGCGGGGKGGGSVVTPPPPTPTYRCADSTVATDVVAMNCLTQITQDVWQLEVRIGGPTTSTDIGGFAFDVLFDPTQLQYVADSARAGPMLFQASADPPLLTAVVLPGDPGRLVVGISRTGGVPGVQGLSGPYGQIMILNVKVQPGAVFDPNPANFGFDMSRSEAFDSSATHTAISSVTFSDQLLLSNH